MKSISDAVKNSLPPPSDGKIVELICVIGGWRKLDNPTMSTDLECPICEGKEHYIAIADPEKDLRKVWICAKLDCETTELKNQRKATYTPTQDKRALLWPEFCEINGLGDIYHNVKFEDIQQAQKKVEYMLKFANKPQGTILMRGDPGSGKTYSAMAICELFTRKSTSAIFTTHRMMIENWLQTVNGDKLNNYIEKLYNISLLVIDDFSTSEATAKFMSFFMNLIDSRLQWTTKGTVITTNLDIKTFTDFCGRALTDRIMTGQHLEFKVDKTRRKKVIL